MNLLLSSRLSSKRGHGRRGSGFTLVEMLVAITVLVIIVLLFGQMLAVMSKAWTYGHGRANNFTKARAMLELIAQDVQAGVFRPDLAAFPSGASGTGAYPFTPDPTNPASWQFYTARPGIPDSSTTATGLRNLSVVQYTLKYTASPTDPTQTFALERADGFIRWSDEASNPYFGSSSTFPATVPTQRDTAPGVVAFEVIFVQADGSLNRTFTPISTAGITNSNPTRAISVTLAVIDDLTIKQFTSAKLLSLATKLALPSPATLSSPYNSSPYNLPQPVKAYWDAYLNGGGMPWTNFPKALGSSLATFERTINLPNAP